MIDGKAKKKIEVSIVQGDTTLPDGRRIILFSLPGSLRRLARADTLCLDGTFRIAPRPLWKQVVIIHAQINEDTYIPVAFALLPDKTLQSYETMLTQLKIALSTNDLELSARYVMADFEDNIRKSVKSIFPDVEMCGMFKHKLSLF